MTRTFFITAVATCAGVLFTASCGGGDPSATGGATTTSTTTTGTTSTTDTTSTSSSTATGGTGGKSFCADGKDLAFGVSMPGDLATTGQEDVYRFSGTKGQVLRIGIEAQSLDDADLDPNHIDTVVTLFDAAGNQLAQNDNPLEFATGDSSLDTILPAGGEYCLRVADCWSVIANPAQTCDAPKDKMFTSYVLHLDALVDGPGDALTAEIEGGDTAASATAIGYASNGANGYATTFWGTFRDQDDVDVWSFTMPSNLGQPSGVRTVGRFYLEPSGSTASGSTAMMGQISVAAASAPSVVLASVDGAKNPRFQPRLAVGKPYLLFVTRPQGATGNNDFYAVRHFRYWGRLLENEADGAGPVIGVNDTAATAEPLAINAHFGYIEGDISTNAQDVDHFIATVPAGTTSADFSCSAQRYGSGLRGLEVSFLKANGTLLAPGATSVETETQYAGAGDVPIGSQTAVILKVQASTQDPKVSESFYVCTVYFH